MFQRLKYLRLKKYNANNITKLADRRSNFDVLNEQKKEIVWALHSIQMVTFHFLNDHMIKSSH